MQGDQLSRQWRAIGASLNGLTTAAIANRGRTGIRTICRYLEALQAGSFPLYTERADTVSRWAFIDTFKFEIPPLREATYPCGPKNPGRRYPKP